MHIFYPALLALLSPYSAEAPSPSLEVEYVPRSLATEWSELARSKAARLERSRSRTQAPSALSSPDAGWYLNVGGGLTSNDDSRGPSSDLDFENGFALIAAVGYHFGPIEPNRLGFELEGELVYTDQDIDRTGTLTSGSETTIFAGFINGIADYSFSESFSIYAGAGVGVAALEVGDIEDGINDFEEDDGPFLAWQLKGGLRWRFSSALSANVGYRFLNVDDAEIDDEVNNVSFDLESAQHIAEIGLRWSL